MKTYRIEESWSGYSRGYAEYEVQAETAREAKEIYMSGGATEVARGTTRDDTESDYESIEEVKS